MSVSLESLRRFEIPGKVVIEAGAGGLPRVAISTPAAQAHIYLHGAHVTHFQPAGHSPLLFTSPQSFYEPTKPIRGGVPVIFPWFGMHATQPELGMHGFVRAREWELEAVEKWADDTVEVLLRTHSDDATRALWPHDFMLRHRIIVGRQLEMRLEVENWSSEPFEYEEALHTYLAVRDIRQVTVNGLDGVDYLDKTEGFKQKPQHGPIHFAGETDRVYLRTESTCVAEDAPGDRRLRVSKENSRTTVVWNPWSEKAAALKDFGDDDWIGMLCIETANTGLDKVKLPPRGAHVMQAVVAVERQ